MRRLRPTKEILEKKFTWTTDVHVDLGGWGREIRELRGQNFDWIRGVIRVRRRKTGRVFEVPIFEHAKPLMEKLKDWARFQDGKQVVQWRNPRRALESACKRLNIPRCEPRALRRCFIVHALEAGIDPRVVARWQGHRDVSLIFRVYGKYIDAGYEKQQAQKLTIGDTSPPTGSDSPPAVG